MFIKQMKVFGMMPKEIAVRAVAEGYMPGYEAEDRLGAARSLVRQDISTMLSQWQGKDDPVAAMEMVEDARYTYEARMEKGYREAWNMFASDSVSCWKCKDDNGRPDASLRVACDECGGAGKLQNPFLNRMTMFRSAMEAARASARVKGVDTERPIKITLDEEWIVTISEAGGMTHERIDKKEQNVIEGEIEGEAN